MLPYGCWLEIMRADRLSVGSYAAEHTHTHTVGRTVRDCSYEFNGKNANFCLFDCVYFRRAAAFRKFRNTQSAYRQSLCVSHTQRTHCRSLTSSPGSPERTLENLETVRILSSHRVWPAPTSVAAECVESGSKSGSDWQLISTKRHRRNFFFFRKIRRKSLETMKVTNKSLQTFSCASVSRKGFLALYRVATLMSDYATTMLKKRIIWFIIVRETPSVCSCPARLTYSIRPTLRTM